MASHARSKNQPNWGDDRLSSCKEDLFQGVEGTNEPFPNFLLKGGPAAFLLALDECYKFCKLSEHKRDMLRHIIGRLNKHIPVLVE